MNDLYRKADPEQPTPWWLVPTKPATTITIKNGATPAVWDSTYTDDGYTDEEACVVYSDDGCPAQWSLPDGTYIIIKIGDIKEATDNE